MSCCQIKMPDWAFQNITLCCLESSSVGLKVYSALLFLADLQEINMYVGQTE